MSLSRDSHCNKYYVVTGDHTGMFQSLYRGTAIATRVIPVRDSRHSRVSIPLSRDSHCNVWINRSGWLQFRGFNPSIEGQPLQLEYDLSSPEWLRWFQSLYRGTAIATVVVCSSTFDGSCFNPSIEGQPLQQADIYRTEWIGYDVSIPLSRDSHCNRAVAEALISNGYNRLFF